MYKKITRTTTSLRINQSTEGKTIEQEIERLINDGVPVENEKQPIFTKPSEGVPYGTDVRDDKWDKAIEVNEKINTSIDNIRKMKLVKNEEETEEKEKTVEKTEDKGSI